MPGRSITVLIGVGAFAAVLVAVLGFTFFMMAYPRVSAPPEITAEQTAERLVRGKTLFENVMGCVGCHSKRRTDRYAMPPVAGSEGGGGLRFGREAGVPGVVYSSNITPFALKDWSDGEIYRAITAGVARDGRVLTPVMPYSYYGQADTEDIFAVIAYMRTLPEIEATHPEPELDFMAKLRLRTFPKDGVPGERPRESDRALFGQYLVRIGGCADCHTEFERGGYVGPPYAGGRVFRLPGIGVIRSANITPDEGTGIGGWSRQQFIDAFSSKTRADYEQMVVAPGEPNTIMPWWEYAGLSQLDISSIYDYLMTLPPTRNKVVTFEKLEENQ